MHRQERVKVGKSLFGKHLVIDAALLHGKMSIILQDALILSKHLDQELLAFLRLTQQTLGNNLLDVIRLNIYLDWETVVETEQLIGVELSLFVVLRKGLLCSGNHPNLATKLILEYLHHSLHIQDQIDIGSHILAYLIQHKDNLVPTRFLLYQLIKTLETLLLIERTIHVDIVIALAIRKISWQEARSQVSTNHIGS